MQDLKLKKRCANGRLGSYLLQKENKRNDKGLCNDTALFIVITYEKGRYANATIFCTI